MLKICQVCGRAFNGHPSAKSCSIKCQQRGKQIRRKEREAATLPPLITDDSPYQLVTANITAETLSNLYTSTLLHLYPRDIRIDGPIPPGVARPPDVILENLGDHHVIYHKARTYSYPPSPTGSVPSP